ncbi:plasmid stabilization system protein [Pusillimonas sp. T7-7]|uniref:type II toxin-antitoxin system RelE/ParE family toxin n=1 Tax=Pusillimonas sp. (strain T7-7) TaxID=1007105 RepID=UPI00020855C0|nr:type II toxin-antitoxin system RelE/ParE family toxin [Pusillimonas sp. T7-7]AEC21968.1 plasmid stabilization system protein [Pusillimonas sp. T7-7]
MAIIILPDAQEDLLALQRYMLKHWNPQLHEKAVDEIFNLLEKIETGRRSGQPVAKLVEVGITDYQAVLTSHHRIVYRKIDDIVFVYIVAGQQQDFMSLLTRRVMQRL